MGNSQERYNVFTSDLEIVACFISKRRALLKMYATAWLVLTFALAINTYFAGTHHFYDYFVNDEASWGTFIVIFVLYPLIFLILYLNLKLLRFLNNKESKKNERI